MGRKASLTREQVEEIRRLAMQRTNSPGMSAKNLATQYNVSYQTILKVLAGKHPYYLESYEQAELPLNPDGTQPVL